MAIFLPFTNIPVETSKGLLLVIGLVVSILFWTVARFSDGKIVIPKSSILLGGGGVVLAFLVSAIFSSASQMSFFGTMFDTNTFWFVFCGFLLMFVSSIIFRKTINARMVLFGVILSSVVVLVFQIFRLFFPAALSLGVLSAATKTDNLLGAWNALGLFAGFLGIMSLFAIEFFSVSKILKIVLGVFLTISVVLIAAVNFMLVWELLGIFALIIFIYKVSFSFSAEKTDGQRPPFPGLSFAVFMISFLFFMSSQFIGGYLPGRLGLSNLEISPSFTTTMSVARQALMKSPVLGIGPNRFAEAWAMYKPADINTTQFWDVSFNSGSGLIPTFVTTTGLIGILAWLAFFVLFMLNGVKSLFSSIKKNVNKEMIAFFVASVYLFVCTLLYSTGPVLFLLALAFAGIFVGLSTQNNPEKEVSLVFSDDPRKSFFSLFVLVFLMIISVSVGFKYIERFASISYFGKALAASDVAGAKTNIIKAVALYPNDLYLRTYTETNLLDINTIVSKGSTLSDEDKTNLQNDLDQATRGANSAIAFDGGNYLNYTTLGSVYSSAAALGTKDAYEQAISAYKQAVTFNPLNPGLKLSMARVAFASNKSTEASDFAKQALTLKPNYVDAFIVLSQISKSGGSTSEAISYAEQALSFDPTNKDIAQYVAILKGGGSAPAPTPTTPDTTKTTPTTKKTTQ